MTAQRGTPVQVKPGTLGLDGVDVGTLTGVVLDVSKVLGVDLALIELDWLPGEAQQVPVDHLLILCPTCERTEPGAFAPRHQPSVRCESGKHPHCSCDTCF